MSVDTKQFTVTDTKQLSITDVFTYLQRVYVQITIKKEQIFTAGNVVRGNRKVMQSECSRELPNMSHGIRQNVNSQVSFHELYFFTVLQLYMYKKENTIPNSIYVCIQNE